MISMPINTEFNDILSVISHEMKSPIALIKANLELLKITKCNEHDNSFDMIFRELENLEKMSINLINSLRNDNTNEKIFVIDLIESALEPYANTHKNIKFTIDCENEDIYILGSNFHIETLINNIVKNAIEAIYEKSNPQINNESFINVQISTIFDKVNIDIIDNGVGLDDENLNDNLPKYYTTKKNGSGLGLSIVKYILNLYDGSINISNNVYGGCTTSIIL